MTEPSSGSSSPTAPRSSPPLSEKQRATQAKRSSQEVSHTTNQVASAAIQSQPSYENVSLQGRGQPVEHYENVTSAAQRSFSNPLTTHSQRVADQVDYINVPSPSGPTPSPRIKRATSLTSRDSGYMRMSLVREQISRADTYSQLSEDDSTESQSPREYSPLPRPEEEYESTLTTGREFRVLPPVRGQLSREHTFTSEGATSNPMYMSSAPIYETIPESKEEEIVGKLNQAFTASDQHLEQFSKKAENPKERSASLAFVMKNKRQNTPDFLQHEQPVKLIIAYIRQDAKYLGQPLEKCLSSRTWKNFIKNFG